MDEIRRIAGRKFDPAKAEILMNEVYPGSDQDVPDPWSGPESGYHEAYRMIDEACEKIVEHYGSRVAAPDPGTEEASRKSQHSGSGTIPATPHTPRYKGGRHD